MSDPQGTPAHDPWAPQASSQQNPAEGSLPTTPQVPQTPQVPEAAAEAPQPAQQPWGAPQAQPQQAQPAQPAQQPWAAPQAQPQPAQPQPQQAQPQWGTTPQPTAAWQGTQAQGGTAWTVAQPGIIPLRPLTVGDLFNGSFQAVRVNPQTMFGFAFAVMAVVGLIQAILTSGSYTNLTNALRTGRAIGLDASMFASGASNLISLLATAFLSGMLALTVWDAVLGRKSSPADAWNRFSPRLVPVLLTMLLIGVIEFVAFLIPIIIFMILIFAVASASGYSGPGAAESAAAGVGSALSLVFLLIVTVIAIACFFTVKFAFASTAVVLEGLGPVDALKRSWNLTKGSFWRILGRVWAIGIVMGIVGAILGAIVGAILGVGIALTTSAIVTGLTTFFTTLISGVAIPVQSSYYTLMYLDERMRKENLAPMIAQEAARI